MVREQELEKKIMELTMENENLIQTIKILSRNADDYDDFFDFDDDTEGCKSDSGYGLFDAIRRFKGNLEDTDNKICTNENKTPKRGKYEATEAFKFQEEPIDVASMLIKARKGNNSAYSDLGLYDIEKHLLAFLVEI